MDPFFRKLEEEEEEERDGLSFFRLSYDSVPSLLFSEGKDSFFLFFFRFYFLSHITKACEPVPVPSLALFLIFLLHGESSQNASRARVRSCVSGTHKKIIEKKNGRFSPPGSYTGRASFFSSFPVAISLFLPPFSSSFPVVGTSSLLLKA